MYAHGRGVRQDSAQAAAWYRKAADQGHAFSQSNRREPHMEGNGVPQDNGKAAEWWRKAAEQGHKEWRSGIGETTHWGAVSRGTMLKRTSG